MNPIRLKLAVVLAVAIALVAIGLVQWKHRDGLSIPDEKVAGVELLAKTQSGPGYFHAANESTAEDGGPWITPDEANAQLDRVVSVRKLSGAGMEKVKLLVSKLTEPHPSRLVGGERIPLVRLNLALDEIKE
ncbi:potassium-transporting ATPase subunit C [Luteolibacter sp. LG18]|uniref:potassium-transporting ATPase subunit C n=1 Tax=Luteolibacter sp. LG18 TaxID=2819286 RepID=UPI002B2D99F4|nr:hypothetical protein llg_18190 [Luteolibacter sp. LG18]